MTQSSAPVAIVLAAGKGTRMKSTRPKVLFEVLGRSIVSRVVDAARDAGCEQVVVVIGHGADAVRAELAGHDVTFAIQHERRGTGDAVAAAREAAEFSGRTLLILPGDVPLMDGPALRGLLDAHAGAGVTVGSFVPADPTGYGRVIREGDTVARIVEHRDATEAERAVGEVNTSIYAMDGSFVFDGDGDGGAISRLGTDNDQGEYYLTDLVGLARDAGLAVRGHVIEDPWAVAGVNDRAQLAELESELRSRVNTRWMQAGVSMDDPASVRIEEAVVLAQDVSLGGGVELRAATRVETGVRIDRGCVLTDCSVGEGATLSPHVVARRADIRPGAIVLPFTVMNGINEKKPHLSTDADRIAVGEGSRIGPFSHLRQSSDVGSGAHVGNFVELKKTKLHPGAKANHLAYLGDAEIGSGSNIGAGVITCNYDGFAKHRTIVGKDVFVGTDSHLVAPVRLGDGAYVATGTTVTKDVPSDALAIGRARQENKAGYAPRIKKQLKSRADRKKAAAAAE